MKVISGIAAAIYTMIAVNFCAYAQSPIDHFSVINDLISQKSFIKAKDLYKRHQKELPSAYCQYIEACLDNAFNRLSSSQKMAGMVIDKKNKLPDSLIKHLWEIKKDNAVKLYHYKEAAAACNKLLKDYSYSLDEKQTGDLKNDLQLWSALVNVPAQRVFIRDNTTLKISPDKAGLKNIPVATGNGSLDFIFDTGANISTISSSAATKLGMKIVPGEVKVGAITGKAVTARLAICKKLLIGNIEVNNAVFLVFDDADLAFPQINYHINGILGFPVIEAMREVTITRNGYFKVEKKTHETSVETNMALNELIPLIFVDGNPFTFDTGADKTILYRPYFLSNRETIIKQYQADTVSFGGAGGGQRCAGYKINPTFHIAGQRVSLAGISLLTDDPGKSYGIYGNIGQDVIGQFNSMTLNFGNMFILFE